MSEQLRRVRITCPEGTSESLKIVDAETGLQFSNCGKVAIVFDAEEPFGFAYLRLWKINDEGTGFFVGDRGRAVSHVEKVLIASLEIG